MARPDKSDSTFFVIQEAQKGDHEAIDEVCRRYLPRLERLATRRLPVAARGVFDTGDIAQEVLVKALQRLDQLQLDTPGAFHCYLRQAIISRLRDEARKAKRRGIVLDLDVRLADHGSSPLEQVIGKVGLERYEAALESLKPADRDAIAAYLKAIPAHSGD